MSFAASHYYYAPVEEALNPLKFVLDKTEVESFSKVMPLERNELLDALYSLKVFLNKCGCLGFEKLKGGDCNAPILVFLLTDSHKLPIYILKYELDCQLAEKRMKAIEDMRDHGLDQLPGIYKDTQGNYLVKLGQAYFSCIEYIEPDSDQSCSLEEMFKLTSNFHRYAKNSSFAEELRQSALKMYANKSSLYLAPELMDWNSLFFSTEAWENCVKCGNYFTSPAFHMIYNRLPTQLIHGDMTPNNIIISKGKRFFIDFDTVRTDVRLLDFAMFSGWSFLEHYLRLTETNKLSSCIQKYYGALEEIEQEYFPIIVLFVRCWVLEWSLRELKQALYDKDLQKEHRFENILKGTVREINEIYHRIPQVKDILR